MKLRFVKIFTSRENEIEKKEEGGKRTNIAFLATTPARPRPEPLFRSRHHPAIIPTLFSSTQSHQPTPSVAHLSAATGRESNILQLSFSSCSASPFLLHKITEAAERGEKNRGGAPTLPTQLSYSTITGRAQLAAPLLLHPIGWPRLLSGSNGILSVAGGAIGKQSMKMNYPVSSSSLMNK